MTSKIGVLFVRACKSKNPDVRIRKVYKRFFNSNGDRDFEDYHIASILINICESNKIVVLSKLFEDLHPNSVNVGLSRFPDIYWESVVQLLIRYIRYAHISKFEGFIIPAKYRKEK